MNSHKYYKVYEASEPEYFGQGHTVQISGLITCIGVAAERFDPKTASLTEVIAGHFVTPKMSHGKLMTPEGCRFLDRMTELMVDQGWDLEDDGIELVCYYAPRLDGKVWDETKDAITGIGDYLGIHSMRTAPTTSTFRLRT